MKSQLSGPVQNAINFIIDQGNYKTPPEISISEGSQEGDGYSSKTYAVTIKDKNRNDSLNLFIKYLLDVVKEDWIDTLQSVYNAEHQFYGEIYPVLDKFQKSKHIKNPFDNVPKYFKVNLNNDDIKPIVLENLRSLGYTLRDRKKIIDDAHLRLPIEAFARYHAISYAMKDQEPENFKKLTAGVEDVFSKNYKKFGMDTMIKQCLNQFLNSLDQKMDQEMLERCKNLDEKLLQFFDDLVDNVDEYSER
nr:uncharacterized protein LOC111420841 [Onthophagus taurus]